MGNPQGEPTPMMKQYLEVKERCPDSILFFRLGDFYEMFNEDAKIVSRELELVLTGKDCGLAERAPMCGIPFHAATSYIGRLIAKGYKVSVCEQLEDPALAKGIVKRDIIKVYTPGTVTDDTMLSGKVNNFIASIYEFHGMYGLAAADLTTGEMYMTSLTYGSTFNHLAAELSRFQASEIILNEGAESTRQIKSLTESINRAYVGELPTEYFDFTKARDLLATEYKREKLSDTTISKNEYAVRAYGALISYMDEMQRTDVGKLMDPQLYEVSQYMVIDASSRRNLELTETMRDRSKKGTLLWVLDRTKTSMGGRLLRHWIDQPLIDVDAINERLDAVSELCDAFMVRSEIMELLDGVYDIERINNKILLGTASPKDMASLRLSLAKMPALKDRLSGFESRLVKYVDSLVDPMEDVLGLLESAIVDDPPALLKDGGVIREGYSSDVDELRRASVSGKDWLSELEARERDKTGIRTLKVGYSKVFGYFLEVSNSFKDQVPDYYVRKQTLVNNERFITDELKKMEDTLLGAEERVIRLESELFTDVRNTVAKESTRLKNLALALATIDALCSLAETADRENYVRPIVSANENGSIMMKQSRHPVIEKLLDGEEFVPNDISIDKKDNKLLIITGPNMAGKSTYMRQAALAIIMAQAGSFVPAESAEISIVDRIFTRVGASDDLASGRSTFMVEMSEVANILLNATDKSFLVLDEIGRGTSTFDGLSIAWAVLEYIAEKIGARTMFATHYHELTELEGRMDGVKNYCSEVKDKDGTIQFMRRIKPGSADGSYGVNVAALAGIPKQVTMRARELSNLLEQEGSISSGSKNKKKTKNVYDTESDVDLFNFTANTVMHDEIIGELSTIDIQSLTPIESMNILYRLQQKAQKKI